MPGWIKFVPLLAAGIIVVGNIFPSLSIWGFDYHVLHLPYGSTHQLWSNLIVIALAIFPLVSTKEGWHHYAYIVLAIFALALLSRNLSFNIYALLFLGPEGVREETGSIFFARTSQRITCTILIVYLLWSLSLASVVRREIGLIFIALAMSAVASSNYMVDIAKRHQNDNIPGNIKPGDKRFAFGEATASNCAKASKEAKRKATHSLGKQPKHVGCRCSGK